MTVGADLQALVAAVVTRTYADFAPLGTARPFAVYQQVGGEAITFVGREVPSKKNGRFQISVWSDSRTEAAAKALSIERALILATQFQALPLGAPLSVYEPDTKLYGSQQDFSVWSER